MLADEQPGADQIRILRTLTPEQRWRASQGMYWSVRRLKAAYLQNLHPEWSQQQLEGEVRRLFLCARS